MARACPVRADLGGEDQLPLTSTLDRPDQRPALAPERPAAEDAAPAPAPPVQAPDTGQPYHVLKIAPTCFFADYGCHVRILEETHALQQQGSRVTLCTYDLGRDLPELDLRRAPRLPWRGGVHTGPTWHKLYVDVLLGLRAGAATLGHRPDLVHAHLHEGAWLGWFVARARGVPLVFDFQGSLTAEMADHDFLSRDHPLFRVFRALEHRINHLADAIVTSSANARELLVRDFGVPAERVFALPDCVNTDRFRPLWEAPPARIAALRDELGIPAGRKVVVYLGLLAEYQGASQLLTAARHLLQIRQDVHFLVMGYPGEARYRRVARDLGIEAHVTFTGRIAYEAAPTYLCLGDVATSPKLSLTEANGKLLNYMAVGLPTVAFDTPVAREILGPLGRFARYGDHVSLAEELSLLLDDPNAGALGRLLRLRADERFSWRDAAGRLTAIYAEVLARRRRGRC